MKTDGVMQDKIEQITQDGYCVIEDVLDADMLEQLRKVSDEMIAQQDAAHLENFASQGCIIAFHKEPFMGRLVAYPRALEVFAGLGFDEPKWLSGFVISKPPGGPPLRWHQDGFWWNQPVSYTKRAQQWFLMYYLVDTTRHNGCLRVLPGSHLKRHALHAYIPEYENNMDKFNRVEDPDHPLFQPADGEVEVPVKAGDLVIGDARLFHSAHRNQSDAWRTVLTLWYWPDFNAMPEETRALIGRDRSETAPWSPHCPDQLIARYEGHLEPPKGSRLPTKELR